MLPKYILAFFRQAARNKVFTILNLLGLSVGMAAFMLLLQFVVYENSFDEFHQNSDNIYRIRYDGYRNGQRMFACAAAVPAVGPAMKNNFPEVFEYSWAFPLSGRPVEYHLHLRKLVLRNLDDRTGLFCEQCSHYILSRSIDLQ